MQALVKIRALERAASSARVRDAMSWPAHALDLRHDIRAGFALRLAADHAIHHFLLMRAGELTGVLCTCDLNQAPAGALVEGLMTRKVVTVGEASRLWRAVARMDDHRINCLPTFSHGAWGIVTRGDLERAGACERPHCFACGASHHVRAHHAYEGQWFCPNCLPRHDQFAHWYDEHGGED